MRYSVMIFVEAESKEEAIRNRCQGDVHAVGIINPATNLTGNETTNGAGTELKKLIDKFGFKPKAGCKCSQHLREMNVKGPEWCEQNIDTIAGWLREEATRAGYPFVEAGAKLLIRRAIKNSRKPSVLSV